MTDLRVQDFHFDLPPELIAQQPPLERGASRMLAMDRATGALSDTQFAQLPSLLSPGDLLVLNDSRVIPARLYAHRIKKASPASPQNRVPPVSPSRPGIPEKQRDQGQAKIEVLLTEPAGENRWRALVKPGKKVSVGDMLAFFSSTGALELEAEVIDRGEFGERTLQFAPVDDFFAALDRIGHMPLPPYIRRDDTAPDRERYQTVFARDPGSVAAPTAGLHFTPQILDAIAAQGVQFARITLHVGLGTFAPLRVDTLNQVRLHRERYTLSYAAADALNRAHREGRRIVAAGTTVVRTLEHCALNATVGQLQPHCGETDIFISPGFPFRMVGALLTNFHLPQSSLLMLVSAFAGREGTLHAYRHAVERQYRFFSYGDCMFIA